MFITNSMSATLIKRNRGAETNTGVYDDEYMTEETIQICPYNEDTAISFGEDTVKEARGYFIVKRTADIKEGDQIVFNGETYSVIKVKDNWIWNKIVNFTVAVK